METEKKVEFCGTCKKNVMAERKKRTFLIRLCSAIFSPEHERRRPYRCPKCNEITFGPTRSDLFLMKLSITSQS